jgi:hypothetical protein
MKVASKSGFLVFLGGIFAARNVAHVRAALTLPCPPASSMITDLIPAMTTALIVPPVYIGALIAPQMFVGVMVPWSPAKQLFELQDWR